jgi:hypothetical protein
MDYTEILKTELERVNMRGNADKETVRKLASIIFDMEQNILVLSKRVEKLTADLEAKTATTKPSATTATKTTTTKTTAPKGDK